jgi:hypothetical protein
MKRIAHLTAAAAAAWSLAIPTAALAADVTPPRLRLFEVDPRVDVLSPDASVRFRFEVTDDDSGFTYGYVTFLAPDKHSPILAAFGSGVAERHAEGVGWIPIWPGMATDTWTVQSVEVQDAAGNGRIYEREELAALVKSPSTLLVNPRGGDSTPPVLIRGHVASTVSLSGATLYGVVEVEDPPGDSGLVTGTERVTLEYCRRSDRYPCFYVENGDWLPAGQRHEVVTVTPNDIGLAEPGTYTLKGVFLRDHGGNHVTLVSTAFGGDTDFSAYFDTTQIVVTK